MKEPSIISGILQVMVAVRLVVSGVVVWVVVWVVVGVVVGVVIGVVIGVVVWVVRVGVVLSVNRPSHRWLSNVWIVLAKLCSVEVLMAARLMVF